MLSHFNTSNVTIQPCNWIYSVRSKFISIHLMLLFNREKMKCGFGIHNFNTSNVTIQHIRCNLKIIFNIHFNTSNVTIQRDKKLVKVWENNISIHLMLLFNGLIRNSGSLFLPDFNTSNVTIQPWRSGVGLQPCHISIHLMLLFNLLIS